MIFWVRKPTQLAYLCRMSCDRTMEYMLSSEDAAWHRAVVNKADVRYRMV